MALSPKELQETIRLLAQKNQEIFPLSLKDKLISRYHHYILQTLEEIFAKSKPHSLAQAQHLEFFLDFNWYLVRGTALSYTARPDDPLTHLLSELALYAEEIFLQHEVQEENQEKTPEEGEEKAPEGKTLPNHLTLLMPGINPEPFYQEDKNLLVPNFNLKTLLKTHILGQVPSYLIPLSIFKPWLENTQAPCFNPHYDYKFHQETLAKLTQEEFNRLSQHSELTRHLLQTKKDYEASLKDSQSLLFHLQTLGKKLYLASKDGLGTEFHAGTLAYIALADFHQYYERLDENTQKAIPLDLKAELELLFTLCTNRGKEKIEEIEEEQEDEDTCVYIRRNTLLAKIKPHEALLASLNITEDTKVKIVEEKRRAYLQALSDFSQTLHGVYELIKVSQLLQPITQAIDLPLQPTSHCHDEFMGVTKESISDHSALLMDPAVKPQGVEGEGKPMTKAEIINLLNQDTLIIVEETQELYSFNATLQELIKLEKNEKNAQAYAELLASVIPPSQPLLFMDLANESLEQSITQEKDHKTITPTEPLHLKEKRQATEKEVSLIKSLLGLPLQYQGAEPLLVNKKLFDFFSIKISIKSQEDLKRFMELDPEEITELTQNPNLQGQIFAQFKSEEDFILFILDTPPSKLLALFKTSAEELYSQRYVFHLSPIFPQLIELFDAERLLIFASSFPQLITNTDNLALLMQKLSLEQNLELIEAIRLPKILQSNAFAPLLKKLIPSQRRLILEALKENFGSFIPDFQNLKALIKANCLDLHQAAFVLKHQPNLITTCQEVIEALSFFNQPKEKEDFIQGLKERLPEMVKDFEDLCLLFSGLDSIDLRAYLLSALKETLAKLINTLARQQRFFILLSPEEISAHIEQHRLNFIFAAADLVLMMDPLSPEQRKPIFESVKDRLPTLVFNQKSNLEHFIIPTIPSLAALLECLSLEDTKTALEILHNPLVDIFSKSATLRQFSFIYDVSIKFMLGSYDFVEWPKNTDLNFLFKSVFYSLSLEKAAIFLYSLEKDLPKMIKYLIDSPLIFSSPKEDKEAHQGLLLRVLKDNLGRYIQTNKGLRELLQELSTENKLLEAENKFIVIETLGENLLGLMKKGPYFGLTMELLPQASASLIFKETQKDLNELIDDVANFKALFLALAEEQELIFESLKEKLITLIQTPQDLEEIFPVLNQERRDFIFAAIKARIPEMIQTIRQLNQVFQYLTEEQRTFVFEAIKARIPSMIKMRDDFKEMFKYLNLEQRNFVVKALSEQDEDNDSLRETYWSNHSYGAGHSQMRVRPPSFELSHPFSPAFSREDFIASLMHYHRSSNSSQPENQVSPRENNDFLANRSVSTLFRHFHIEDDDAAYPQAVHEESSHLLSSMSLVRLPQASPEEPNPSSRSAPYILTSPSFSGGFFYDNGFLRAPRHPRGREEFAVARHSNSLPTPLLSSSFFSASSSGFSASNSGQIHEIQDSDSQEEALEYGVSLSDLD